MTACTNDLFQCNCCCTCISTTWLVYMYFNFMISVNVSQFHDCLYQWSFYSVITVVHIFANVIDYTNDRLQCNHCCTCICLCDRLHQWPFTVWSLSYMYLPMWLMVPAICSSAKTCDQSTLFTHSITGSFEMCCQWWLLNVQITGLHICCMEVEC